MGINEPFTLGLFYVKGNEAYLPTAGRHELSIIFLRMVIHAGFMFTFLIPQHITQRN